jgi:hypothetical protein
MEILLKNSRDKKFCDLEMANNIGYVKKILTLIFYTRNETIIVRIETQNNILRNEAIVMYFVEGTWSCDTHSFLGIQ